MMKRKITLILVAGLFSFSSLLAQTTLTYKTHAIKKGDDHHFMITNNAKPGEAGADMVWDFSDLKYKKDLVSHMLPPADVARGGEIPGANAVIQEYQNKFAFKVKPDRVEQFGSITCGNSIIKYNDPFVKMVFPFGYGDIHTGEFSGVIENNGNSRPFTGHYELLGDGYGKLILPDGIEVEDVLRLRTSKTKNYGNCGEVTTVTYRWYCPDVRYPLLSIITRERNDETNVIRTAYHANINEELKKSESLKKSTHGVLSQNNHSLDVFPNPYEDHFAIRYNLSKESNVKIAILNNTGKEVLTKKLGRQEAGNHSYQVNAEQQGMKSGLYFVKLILDNTILTEKIVAVE